MCSLWRTRKTNTIGIIFNMITKEEIEQIRNALNTPENNREHYKRIVKAEHILDKLTEIVSSSDLYCDIFTKNILNKYVTIKGENFTVYNVSLMLAPEEDGDFKYVWYGDLQK